MKSFHQKLKTLRDALQAETVKGLKDAGLNFASIEAYAAPRRLALKIVDIDAAQADTQNVLMVLQFKQLTMQKATRLKHSKALCVAKVLLLISFLLSKQVKLKSLLFKRCKRSKP